MIMRAPVQSPLIIGWPLISTIIHDADHWSAYSTRSISFGFGGKGVGFMASFCAGGVGAVLLTDYGLKFVERQVRLLVFLGKLAFGLDPIVLGQLAEPALFLFTFRLRGRPKYSSNAKVQMRWFLDW